MLNNFVKSQKTRNESVSYNGLGQKDNSDNSSTNQRSGSYNSNLNKKTYKVNPVPVIDMTNITNTTDKILTVVISDLETIDSESMLENLVKILNSIQEDITKKFENSKYLLKIQEIFEKNFETIINYFIRCLQHTDAVKNSVSENLSNGLAQLNQIVAAELEEILKTKPHPQKIQPHVSNSGFVFDEEFVALINTLSSSIKEFMKNTKACVKTFNKFSDSSVDQIMFSKSHLSDVLMQINSTLILSTSNSNNKTNISAKMGISQQDSNFKLMKEKLNNVIEQIEHLNNIRTNTSKNIKHIDSYCGKFYDDAKVIFKKLKILHNEKLTEIQKLNADFNNNSHTNNNNSPSKSNYNTFHNSTNMSLNPNSNSNVNKQLNSSKSTEFFKTSQSNNQTQGNSSTSTSNYNYNYNNNNVNRRKVDSLSPYKRNNNNPNNNNNTSNSFINTSSNFDNSNSFINNKNPAVGRSKIPNRTNSMNSMSNTRQGNGNMAKSTDHFYNKNKNNKNISSGNNNNLNTSTGGNHINTSFGNINLNTSANANFNTNPNINSHMNENILNTLNEELKNRNEELLLEISKLHETYVSTQYENMRLKQENEDLKINEISNNEDLVNQQEFIEEGGSSSIFLPKPLGKSNQSPNLNNSKINNQINASGTQISVGQNIARIDLNLKSKSLGKLFSNVNNTNTLTTSNFNSQLHSNSITNTFLNTSSNNNNLLNSFSNAKFDSMLKLSEMVIVFIKQMSSLQDAISKKSTNVKDLKKDFEITKKELISFAKEIKSKHLKSEEDNINYKNVNSCEIKEEINKTSVKEKEYETNVENNYISNLNEDINNLNFELEKLSQEYNSEKESLNLEIINLKNNNESLHEEIKKLNSNLNIMKQFEVENKKLMKEMNNLKINNELAIKENNQFKKDNELLLNQIRDLNNTIFSNNSNLEEVNLYKEQIKELEQEISKLNSKRSIQENKINLKGEVELKKSDQIIKELKEDLNIKKLMIDAINEEINKKTNLISTLNDQNKFIVEDKNNQISIYTSKVEEFKSQIVKLNEEIMVFKSKAKELEDTKNSNIENRDTFENFENTISNLEKENSELKMKININIKLENEVINLRKKIADHEDENIELKIKNSSITKADYEIQNLNATIQDLEKSISDNEKEYLELHTKNNNTFKKLELEIKNLKIEKSHLDSTISSFEKENLELKSKNTITIKKLELEINKLKINMDHLESTVSTLEKENSELKSKNNITSKKLELEIQNLKTEKDHLDSTISSLEKENSEVKIKNINSIKKFETEIQNLKSNKDNIENTVSSLEKENAELKFKNYNSVKKLESEIQNLKAEKDNLESTISIQEKDNFEFENKNNSNKIDIQNLKKNIFNLEQTILSLEQDNTDLKSKNNYNTKLDTEIQTLKKKISDYEKEISLIKENQTTKEINNNQYQTQNQKLLLDIKDKDNEYFKNTKSINDELSTNSEKIKKISQDLSQREKELNEYKDKYNKLNLNKTDTNSLISALNLDLENHKLKLNEVDKSCKKISSEKDTIKTEFNSLSNLIKTLYDSMNNKYKELLTINRKSQQPGLKTRTRTNADEAFLIGEDDELSIKEELFEDDLSDNSSLNIKKTNNHELINEMLQMFLSLGTKYAKLNEEKMLKSKEIEILNLNNINVNNLKPISQSQSQSQSQSLAMSKNDINKFESKIKELKEENKRLQNLFEECTQTIYDAIVSTAPNIIDEMNYENTPTNNILDSNNSNKTPATPSEADFIQKAVEMFKKYNMEINEENKKLKKNFEQSEANSRRFKIMADEYKSALDLAITRGDLYDREKKENTYLGNPITIGNNNMNSNSITSLNFHKENVNNFTVDDLIEMNVNTENDFDEIKDTQNYGMSDRQNVNTYSSKQNLNSKNNNNVILVSNQNTTEPDIEKFLLEKEKEIKDFINIQDDLVNRIALKEEELSSYKDACSRLLAISNDSKQTIPFEKYKILFEKYNEEQAHLINISTKYELIKKDYMNLKSKITINTVDKDDDSVSTINRLTVTGLNLKAMNKSYVGKKEENNDEEEENYVDKLSKSAIEKYNSDNLRESRKNSQATNNTAVNINNMRKGSVGNNYLNMLNNNGNLNDSYVKTQHSGKGESSFIVFILFC